jgi:DNA-binding MarR family transcriptional regulator
MSSVSSVVDDVRGFNRFYTRVLGLLRPHLVGSSFGLTEARVLFELAHRGDVEASDLGSELDLDAGYLSRILSGFTASGLVTRERSATDGRRQVVRLTGDGRQAFAEIDQLQARAIDNILAALDEAQRKELVTSMGESAGYRATSRAGPACCFARRSGYPRITLWTNDVLVAARRIYERAGFERDRHEPHHSFGHDLVGEYWSRGLSLDL